MPERTVRENWRKWGLTAHKVGRPPGFASATFEAWLQRNTDNGIKRMPVTVTPC